MSPLLAVGLLAGAGYALFRFTRGQAPTQTHVEPPQYPPFVYDPCIRMGSNMQPCPETISEANPLHTHLIGSAELVGETTGDSLARAGTVDVIGLAAPGVFRVKLPNDPTHEVYRVSADLVFVP